MRKSPSPVAALTYPNRLSHRLRTTTLFVRQRQVEQSLQFQFDSPLNVSHEIVNTETRSDATETAKYDISSTPTANDGGLGLGIIDHPGQFLIESPPFLFLSMSNSRSSGVSRQSICEFISDLKQ